MRQRLRGLLGRASLGAGSALCLDPCKAIHTIGMRFPIDVVFLSRTGVILRIDPAVPPRRVRLCVAARSVLELAAGEAHRLGLSVGKVISTSPVSSPGVGRERARRRVRGGTLVELVVTLPILCTLGLAILQIALLMHARMVLSYAASQATRAASHAGAQPQVLTEGFARGLAPWLVGAHDAPSSDAALAQSLAHVTRGLAQGWILFVQDSPNPRGFADWGVAVQDAQGQIQPGLVRIPNDNLPARIATQLPASGVAGMRTQAPIGMYSGQTLADANRLRVQIVYAVPLRVPLVGALLSGIMRALDGCASSTTAVSFPLASAGSWSCAFYQGVDAQGRAQPSWPVRVSAEQRMQSDAIDAGLPLPAGFVQAGTWSASEAPLR